MNLNLIKPLIVLDLETTGLNLVNDRIIEYCLYKIHPDGKKEIRTQLINPEMPIPPESTAIHGISDKDVAQKPVFKEIAHELNTFIGNADLAGYNSNKFDIPLIVQDNIKMVK